MKTLISFGKHKRALCQNVKTVLGSFSLHQAFTQFASLFPCLQKDNVTDTRYVYTPREPSSNTLPLDAAFVAAAMVYAQHRRETSVSDT